MRRQFKIENSKIIEENLVYIQNGNNSKLRDILFAEQKGYCAYTETFLCRSDQKDIDHFNPSADFPDRNKYQNLFLVKALWNREKSNKWNSFQPILNPLSQDFEERVIYNKDLKIFESKSSDDHEARNLVSILKLDDYDLSVERKRYISRIEEIAGLYGISIESFIQKRISQQCFEDIIFIRSISEEFGIDVWSMIPEITH